MSHLRLALLGAPLIQHNGQVITFRTRKALALLIYLAVEGGLHSREKLAALFWPESDQSQGRTTLRSTLAYLRSALKKGAHLIIRRDALGFNVEADVDADWLTLQAAWTAARNPAQFSAQQADERSGLTTLLTQLQVAADLYRSDFLTGFSLEDAPDFDDWASFQRETCHRQMGLVFDRLSQLQAEGGELINGIETTSRWVALDPLNEVAHRRLMQLHFAAEDQAAALLAYEAYQTILARELNADPTPETQALADRIRAHDLRSFGLAQDRFQVSDLRFGAGSSNRQSQSVNRKLVELPLVGRVKEHLALVTAYRTMRRGQPQVVTLEGEAGIGKTRLAREFLGWAMAQGADVLQGRAFEASSRLPYQAVVEALRERLEQENAPDDLLSDPWLAELSHLLPELRERYPDLPLPSTEETTAQTRLFEAVARLCQALAQRTPLILFLDDLQWADAASLDMLQYASRRWAAAGSPVLLLITLRAEELDMPGDESPGPGLNNWLMTLQRDMPLTRLALDPLDHENIHQLMQKLVHLNQTVDEQGTKPQQRVTKNGSPSSGIDRSLEQFSQRLFAETGGQPFFLVETLKLLFERPGAPPDETGQKGIDPLVTLGVAFDEIVNRYLQESNWPKTPPSVQEMISARLARLSPAARVACLAAAVLGDSFDFERLCRVAGLAENDGLEALEELLKRGLLREQRQARARPYVLAHDRFREVIYNQAGHARRRIFHRRAFEVLAEINAPPAELARHAQAAGLLEQAFELNIKAGEEAKRLYAPQAAIDYLSQALEVAQQLAITPPPQLYRARGQAYETVGDFERAQGDFQLALEQAQTRNDRQSEWQALQDLGFLWASRNYTQAGDFFRQALSLARASDEPATLAHSLNRVGNWHLNIEQPFEALAYHREALAIFERLAERRGLAETLDLLGMANFMGGDLFESLASYERAVALFRELDNRPGLVSSLPMMSLVMRGIYTVEVLPNADLTKSASVAESAAQIAREIEWRAGESNALIALGLIHSFQGNYGQALTFVENGLAIAVEIEHPLWITFAKWALGVIHLDLLALPTAQQHFEQALTQARETDSMLWTRASAALLALAHIQQNELDQAEAVLLAIPGSDDGQPNSVEYPTQTAMQRLAWYARTELALACHKPHLAYKIVEQLIASATNIAGDQPALRLSKLRGETLTALGQMAEAEAALHEAQKVAEKQEEPPMLWRIHLALGRLYQTWERQEEAAQEFAAAQSVTEALAANIPDVALRDNFRRNVAIPH